MTSLAPYLLVCAAALLASGLTLFSGFGLGTLLLPAFALFFPPEQAVGLTAAVHLLNNVFKLALVGRHADREAALRLGLPAILASFLGAELLAWLAGAAPLVHYHAFGRELHVTPVKLCVGALMTLFALLELSPAFGTLSFDRRWLPVGGVLTGFFGGLSGHQGALRSAFLVRCGLSKEAFIGTGVLVACLVDLTRLGVYTAKFPAAGLRANAALLGAATLSAFLGAWLGSRFIHKVTLRAVQRLVALMLLAIAAGLAAGAL